MNVAKKRENSVNVAVIAIFDGNFFFGKLAFISPQKSPGQRNLSLLNVFIILSDKSFRN